jgi:hypothetical protein
MERIITDFISWLKESIERLTGNTNNWKILSPVGAAGSYVGSAKYLLILDTTTFTAFDVDNASELSNRGMTSFAWPANVIVSGGSAKRITGFTIADGGKVQIFE